MTFNDQFADLRGRIAKAEAERDAWRASGMQEKYLEAYSAVEALELQLEGLREEGLRPSAEPKATAPAPARSPDAAGDRRRLMAEFAITYNGRYYFYDRYRYDRLDDALEYAKLQGSSLPRGGSSDGADPMPAPELIAGPGESQRELMVDLAITFQDGIYRLGDYRYERLADAVDYARLRRLQGRDGSPAT